MPILTTHEHAETLFIVLIALSVLALTGCQRDEQVWIDPTTTDEAAPNQAPENHRIVLFAPVSLGAVAEVDPDAATRFPHDLIKWLGLNADMITSRVGATLPEANDSVWNQGGVAAAAGANIIALLTVDKVEQIDGGAGQDDTMEATVTLRAVNVAGESCSPKHILAKRKFGRHQN